MTRQTLSIPSVSSSPDARTLYDRTAAGWARHQPSSLSDYTARPQVMALCEPVAGKQVLDLGRSHGVEACATCPQPLDAGLDRSRREHRRPPPPPTAEAA